MLEESNFPKWQNSIFNCPYILQKAFKKPELTRDLLPLAHITQIIKREYLTFMK